MPVLREAEGPEEPQDQKSAPNPRESAATPKSSAGHLRPSAVKSVVDQAYMIGRNLMALHGTQSKKIARKRSMPNACRPKIRPENIFPSDVQSTPNTNRTNQSKSIREIPFDCLS
jgi:hypothetical protein